MRKELVVTVVLLHAGPCKAHGHQFWWQQDYQLSFHDFILKLFLFYEKTKMHIDLNVGETGHHSSASWCWTMQIPWLTCLTTTGLLDISGFSVWKLKWILFFLGLKFGSSWLVMTSELLPVGPCKAHGQHVLQQQGYLKSLRKTHMILYTNRICSMKKLKAFCLYFDQNVSETCHHFSVSSCWTMQSHWWTCLKTTGFPDISGFAIWKLKIILIWWVKMWE